MPLHKYRQAFLIFYTTALVLTLKLLGKKIKVGKNTIIYPSAKIYPNNGIIKIGAHCRINPGAILRAWDGAITIGNHVSVNYYAVLYGQGGLYIGNDVRIAPHTMIVSGNREFNRRDIPIRLQPTRRLGIWIGNDVWIGSGVKILDGTRVRRGCVIGAGAIVTKSTEPYGVYAGNPARKIKSR